MTRRRQAGDYVILSPWYVSMVRLVRRVDDVNWSSEMEVMENLEERGPWAQEDGLFACCVGTCDNCECDNCGWDECEWEDVMLTVLP